MRPRNLYILLAVIFSSLSAWPIGAQVTEEDILHQIIPGNKPAQTDGAPKPPENAKGDLAEPFKILVDGDVSLNYVFAESPDTFVVNYKVHLEGMARSKVDVIKGNGQITASVKGFLAKWPTGECQLKVGVGEVPYEMIFSKVEEEQVRLDIKLPESILENWESNCKFVDAPGSKFNTKGNPEKWIYGALKRTAPSLKDLQLPIDRLHKGTTTLPWTIDRYLLPDPPLGSVEMEGKGKVQIIPTI